MTGGPIRFDIDGDERVAEVFDKAPEVAYRYLRDYVFQSFLDHRKNWLRVKGVKFGRGGRGIKVYRVGEEGPTTNKTVHYVVPKSRRARSKGDAITKLRRFNAEVRTGSEVLEHHQKGGTITKGGGRRMAIAVKTRPGDPRQWRAKYPNKKLRYFDNKVFEEIGKRKKRLRLRWVQVRTVKNRPTLKFYETWAKLKPLRDTQWRKAADLMIDAMKRGNG